MALIDTLESAWYGQGRAPWWTWLLAKLYGAAIRLRRALYRIGWLRSTRLAVPVVVIGNLSVGGTGKTPLTIAVGERLRATGWKPGVVSRGYGGTQREPMLLTDASTPSQVGDEPCLIHASGLPVAIGRDRAHAAQWLIARGCDVVIADDGLQHYALARDVEICVIDGARRFGNRRLLPAGPLREPMSRLDSVDFRVCNGGEVAAGEHAMRLHGDEAIALSDGRRLPLADFAGRRVHAAAAIGNPARFFDSLRAVGMLPLEHAFADHHAFVASDLDFGDDLPVLMTDKDAVKCRAFARPHWWHVPVRAELADAFHAALDRRLRARKNI